MELLLNLCWVLLIGPGFYLWLRQRRRAKPTIQLSIALVCLLFLLFPVISATDDLHAMRQEMEESSANKRALKQVAKRTGQDFNAPLAQVPGAVRVLPAKQVCGAVLLFQPASMAFAVVTISVSRAPPTFFLV